MNRSFLSVLLVCIAALSQSQNLDVSGGFIYEGEPFLLVDPSNHNHLVVSWMGYIFGQPTTIKTKTSWDGGATWSSMVPLPHQSTEWKSADPSMVIGDDGLITACYIDRRESPDTGGVYIARSLDGGISWGQTQEVINGAEDPGKYPIDRPWISRDNSNGLYSGNLYVTTKPAPWIPAPNRAYFLRSSDNGDSWSPWQYVDAPNYLIGSAIAAPMTVSAVDAAGRLHLAYPSWVLAQNILPGFYMATSEDGGASFSYDPMIFSIASGSDSLAKVGYQLIADPSDADHLAFLFLFGQTGDLDASMIETFDGGLNWTPIIRLNDDPIANGKMQDLVWGDFDDDGDLIVAWRDRRNGNDAEAFYAASEIWGTHRCADSTSFEPNFQISDQQAVYTAILSQSGNDFMNAQLAGDTLFAVWGDVRLGYLNIWFEKRPLSCDGSTFTAPIASEELPSFSIYPNPASDFIVIDAKSFISVSIRDETGRVVLNSVNRKVDITSLSAGKYFVDIHTQLGEVGSWIVIASR